MTTEEKKKIYAALSAPFAEEAIERTDSRVTGRGYSTTGIKYQFIINRLNEVLSIGSYRAHRTVTVKEIQTAKGRPAFEAICDLTLELGEWIEGQFVCWAESLADGGHTSMSESDARKGAYTNAIKKAAAFFGVGKQAYEGTIDDDNIPGEATQESLRTSSSPASPSSQPKPELHSPRAPTAPGATQDSRQTNGSPRPLNPLPSRNRLTSKQLAALWALARKAGYDQSQFRSMVKQQAGCQPEFLSRELASRFISDLSAQVGNGQAGQEEQRQPGQEG